LQSASRWGCVPNVSQQTRLHVVARAPSNVRGGGSPSAMHVLSLTCLRHVAHGTQLSTQTLDMEHAHLRRSRCPCSRLHLKVVARVQCVHERVALACASRLILHSRLSFCMPLPIASPTAAEQAYASPRSALRWMAPKKAAKRRFHHAPSLLKLGIPNFTWVDVLN